MIRFEDHKTTFPERLVEHELISLHSSANVKTAFSTVNLNKTKLRNRLDNSRLEAMLHVKTNLIMSGHYYYNFEERDRMFQF